VLKVTLTCKLNVGSSNCSILAWCGYKPCSWAKLNVSKPTIYRIFYLLLNAELRNGGMCALRFTVQIWNNLMSGTTFVLLTCVDNLTKLRWVFDTIDTKTCDTSNTLFVRSFSCNIWKLGMKFPVKAFTKNIIIILIINVKWPIIKPARSK
jgi:hypothetical protein